MPELPDVELYLTLLRQRLVGHRLVALRVFNPFVLRSVTPPAKHLEGRDVVVLRRLGKRIVFEFSDQFFLIVHLMIAGRFRWMENAVAEARLGGKIAMAALTFDNGTLFLTEAGSKKRASLTVVEGEASLASHDPGGIDVLSCTLSVFEQVLRAENHGIKDTLTNPRLFSGIGNAYSDEILHAAKISPHRLTKTLMSEEIERLHAAMQTVLRDWIKRLEKQFANKFPGAGDITAFRPEFAVHGKFGQPCPVCGKPVQRIVFADNEANYCAQCQNGGRILADRAMSRLLKGDFPRTLDGG